MDFDLNDDQRLLKESVDRLMADRYANHLADLWTMQLILVTEYGWLDFMTYEAGLTPALVRAPSAAR